MNERISKYLVYAVGEIQLLVILPIGDHLILPIRLMRR